MCVRRSPEQCWELKRLGLLASDSRGAGASALPDLLDPVVLRTMPEKIAGDLHWIPGLVR